MSFTKAIYRLAHGASIISALAVLIVTTTVANAQNTGLATIGFSYSGLDVTGEGGSSAGTGSFSVATGPNPISSLSSLFSFNFSQTTNVLEGVSSYSYSLGDLNNFSLSFPSGQPSLSLSTNAVYGTNTNFFPEAFSVSGNAAHTSNLFGTLQQGSISIDQASLAKAIAANSVTTSYADFGREVLFKFTPNFGLTITQAATASGFASYNWISKISSPLVFYNGLGQPLPVNTPYNDPPANGYRVICSGGSNCSGGFVTCGAGLPAGIVCVGGYQVIKPDAYPYYYSNPTPYITKIPDPAQTVVLTDNTFTFGA